MRCRPTFADRPVRPSSCRRRGTRPGRTPRVRLGGQREPYARAVEAPPRAGGRLAGRRPGSRRPCAVPSPRLGLAAALGDVGRQRTAGGHPRPRRRPSSPATPATRSCCSPMPGGRRTSRRPARGNRQPWLRRRGPAHVHEVIPTTELPGGGRRWFRRRPWPARASVLAAASEDVRERGAVVDTKAGDLASSRQAGRSRRGAAGAAGGTRRQRGGSALGRLDLGRVGVLGRSFGGGGGPCRLQRDARVTAGANLDGGGGGRPSGGRDRLSAGVATTGSSRPARRRSPLKMYSSVEWCEQDRALHVSAWSASSGRPDGRLVQIRGAEHGRSWTGGSCLGRWSIGRPGTPRSTERAWGRRPAEACSRCRPATEGRAGTELRSPAGELGRWWSPRR